MSSSPCGVAIVVVVLAVLIHGKRRRLSFRSSFYGIVSQSTNRRISIQEERIGNDKQVQEWFLLSPRVSVSRVETVVVLTVSDRSIFWSHPSSWHKMTDFHCLCWFSLVQKLIHLEWRRIIFSSNPNETHAADVFSFLCLSSIFTMMAPRNTTQQTTRWKSKSLVRPSNSFTL